jgi:hypothetical protein
MKKHKKLTNSQVAAAGVKRTDNDEDIRAAGMNIKNRESKPEKFK